MSSRSAKRPRTGDIPPFGATSDLDSAIFQTNEPSTRALPLTTVPTLVTFCNWQFVSSFKKLRENHSLWDNRISRQLQLLPDSLIPRLFALLKKSHSGYLPHELIVTYFLRGFNLSLSSDSLPGANKGTLLAIPRFNPQVYELDITGFTKIADEVFAKVIKESHSLRSLVLRGCTKVGSKTVAAVVQSCSNIRRINLSDTSVSPAAVGELILTHGKQLEVLKLAGLERWTDATFMAQLHPQVREQAVNMPKLQTLKLRGLQLSDSSIDFLVSLSPNLRRLDISFTLTKRPMLFTFRKDVFSTCAVLSTPPLEKLSLTSTRVAAPELLQIVSSLPHIQTISLGALGAVGSMGVASATTLNNTTLSKLTDTLESFPNLRSVNLVSNTRLSGAAVFDFIERIGRKCSYLNLAGITTLRSDALAALLPIDGTHSVLETLILNNTSVGDDAGPYIACCPDLVRLEVEGTKFSSEGLFPIVDACPKLQVLNLTACRGVRIADRRQFFELWQSQKEEKVS
ncbi:RNI-like protein [Lentinula raphanica]|uniref:RNI-like protein n=1 Tax=Lentinula raphanica TaxID=153919 RepID=A0AA38PDS5_9AGAR|nr:RNI-like protein [Lentinula raphanica]KAJ3841073.1 RNI-like protein [Lentinula raphanica]KAJ3967523.1 RNI-like protein [Lentinula raphanica]